MLFNNNVIVPPGVLIETLFSWDCPFELLKFRSTVELGTWSCAILNTMCAFRIHQQSNYIHSEIEFL